MSKKEQKKSHEQLVLEHLLSHDGLTQAEAVDLFKCYRLSARIKDLRTRGINIISERRYNRETGSNYACYHLGENNCIFHIGETGFWVEWRGGQDGKDMAL